MYYIQHFGECVILCTCSIRFYVAQQEAVYLRTLMQYDIVADRVCCTYLGAGVASGSQPHWILHMLQSGIDCIAHEVIPHVSKGIFRAPFSNDVTMPRNLILQPQLAGFWSDNNAQVDAKILFELKLVLIISKQLLNSQCIWCAACK